MFPKQLNPSNPHRMGERDSGVDLSREKTLSLSTLREELMALGKLQKQALLASSYHRMSDAHQAAYDRRRERIGELLALLRLPVHLQ
jgi:hypothetical protein